MPTIGSQPSLRATQAVGAVLLHQFARERFLEAGLDENLILEAEDREHLDDLTTTLVESNGNSNGSSSSETDTIHNCGNSESNQSNSHNPTASSVTSPPTIDRLQSSPSFALYGQELRRIADEFEKSRLRQSVKNKAEKVNLSDITKESFMQLLEELFQDKITREKIVILFFFCTDVALRAASFASELVVRLMSWSFSYIVNIVCNLVHQLGGWDKILFQRLPSILITCCSALAIACLLVYLKKNLNN